MSWKRVALFYGVTFAVTHGISLGFVALGGSWQSPAWVWLAQVIMLVPGLTALALQRFAYRRPVRQGLAILFRPNRWFLVAWLLPLALAFATLGASLLLPWVDYDPEMRGVLARHMLSPAEYEGGLALCRSLGIHPLILFVASWLGLGLTFSMAGGLGEEIGWRGLLYAECEPLGFWRSCLVIGVLWGLWHVPQVLLGHLDFENRAAGAAFFAVMVLLYTPIFNYVRLRSGSAVAAALFHSSGNAAAMIAVAPTRGGDAYSVGIGSVTFCVLLLAVDVGLFVFDPGLSRSRLRRRASAGTLGRGSRAS